MGAVFRAVIRPVGAVLACIVLLSGCGSGSFEKEMNAIAFPTSWQLATTTAKDGCFPLADPYCPSVTRYLLTLADLVAVYQDARAAVAAVGFDIEDISPRCDGVPDGPRCAFFARKNGFRVDLTIYPPGENV